MGAGWERCRTAVEDVVEGAGEGPVGQDGVLVGVGGWVVEGEGPVVGCAEVADPAQGQALLGGVEIGFVVVEVADDVAVSSAPAHLDAAELRPVQFGVVVEVGCGVVFAASGGYRHARQCAGRRLGR